MTFVHTRRVVALGRVSAKNAEEVCVAHFDSVMVWSTAQVQTALPAEERSTQARRLLEQVEKMHCELMREVSVKSLFAAMVDVARHNGTRAGTQRERGARADQG